MKTLKLGEYNFPQPTGFDFAAKKHIEAGKFRPHYTYTLRWMFYRKADLSKEKNPVIKFFWKALDFLHIVRSTISDRYDCDESSITIAVNWSNPDKTVYTLRKRAWYEYVVMKNATRWW
jgi:hypothetical protein